MVSRYECSCSECEDRSWDRHVLRAGAEADAQIHNGLVHPDDAIAEVRVIES